MGRVRLVVPVVCGMGQGHPRPRKLAAPLRLCQCMAQGAALGCCLAWAWARASAALHPTVLVTLPACPLLWCEGTACERGVCWGRPGTASGLGRTNGWRSCGSLDRVCKHCSK